MDAILNFLKENKKTALTIAFALILIIAKALFDISWEDIGKWLEIFGDIFGGSETPPPAPSGDETGYVEMAKTLLLS